MEGYPATLVHGPLTCTLLLHLLHQTLLETCSNNNNTYIRRFEYRAVNPVFCGEDVRLCLRWERHCPESSSMSTQITQDTFDESEELELIRQDGQQDAVLEKKCELWAETKQAGLVMSGTAIICEKQ